MQKVLLKLIKRLFLLTIMFAASFFLIGSVRAASVKTASTQPKRHAIYKRFSYKPLAFKSKNYVRELDARIYYGKANGKITQLYCIEQGVYLKHGDSVEKILKEYVFSAETPGVTCDKNCRIQLISEIISVGYKFEAKDDENETNYRTRIENDANVAKIIATQELIWEVARGERDNLTSYYPNVKCKKDKTYCPFYNLIKSKGNETVNIYNEYKRIIDAAKYTFKTVPSKFSLKGDNANIYNMNYDGQYFVLKLSNKNYKYFKFSEANDNNVWIERKSDKDPTITIKSSKPIDKPVLITASFDSPNALTKSFAVYKIKTGSAASDPQALATGTASANYYLKVQTPDYQIKIIKKDSITGKALAGVKFAICSKNTCDKSSIITTVTTDNNGVATYNKITKPATYYIKEISVPPGYKVDSKVISIKVTTDNVAGSDSFAIIEVKNSPKEFNLIKYTVDENGKKTKLNSDCGTDKGPIFELQNSKGEKLYFTKISNGVYNFSNSKVSGATTSLTTCNGEFKVYTLTECNYKITEVKAPEGLTLPSNPSRTLNVCGSDKTVSFINGLTGLEFQKKDEDGNFISGGKFSLQMKVNNVYKDMLLKKREDGNYLYVENLKDTDEGATYELITDDGIFTVSKLPPGEYRVVEKEAPEGYELVKDKDSKALVTITDENKDGYYITEMINHKVSSSGSNAFAELVITIITGRKVINYVFIISSLLVALTILLLVRRKLKKK